MKSSTELLNELANEPTIIADPVPLESKHVALGRLGITNSIVTAHMADQRYERARKKRGLPEVAS